ncbi:hypothetical protein EVAR_13187_1 [Eumeta japonica]|uniref:Uncharacterized protein n=1 Tax=Eumeta variegata TaxID=151549 RepID=A0A4C1TS21_EUMVA|nr:hypothetical protein EVAR_13187_1 [Eumeta japonica]
MYKDVGRRVELHRSPHLRNFTLVRSSTWSDTLKSACGIVNTLDPGRADTPALLALVLGSAPSVATLSRYERAENNFGIAYSPPGKIL